MTICNITHEHLHFVASCVALGWVHAFDCRCACCRHFHRLQLVRLHCKFYMLSEGCASPSKLNLFSAMVSCSCVISDKYTCLHSLYFLAVNGRAKMSRAERIHIEMKKRLDDTVAQALEEPVNGE